MSKLQDVQNQKSYKYLYEVEQLAQDILTEKTEKLELSNTRNKFREALRATETTADRKLWIQLGSVYVERPRKEVTEILRREIANADRDLEEFERNIKDKINKLRDLEHEPRLEGFTLKPISLAEAKALHRGFGDI